MKLIYYKSEPNVGDALNVWLWTRLLKNLLDDDPEHIFLGIGTILIKGYVSPAKKITVFGSGARSRRTLPDLTTGEWDIRFVRGPRTAAMTGAPYITDPAVLLPTLLPVEANPKGLGFVPHFKTSPETISQVSERLGARVISPRLEVEEFARKLKACEAVVCEAMHGAIIADAYRIPWAGVRADVAYRAGKGNVFKWLDWSESLGIPDRFAPLPLICHAPMRIRMRFRSIDWRVLENLTFDLSPDGALERAQGKIMDEVHALKREQSAF